MCQIESLLLSLLFASQATNVKHQNDIDLLYEKEIHLQVYYFLNVPVLMMLNVPQTSCVYIFFNILTCVIFRPDPFLDRIAFYGSAMTPVSLLIL